MQTSDELLALRAGISSKLFIELHDESLIKHEKR